MVIPHTGLYMDAQASLEYLLSRRDIDKRKIIIFGRSLGGAVAISLAASVTYSDKWVWLVLNFFFRRFSCFPFLEFLL